MSGLEQGTRKGCPSISDRAEVTRRWRPVPGAGSKADPVIRMGTPIWGYDMYGHPLRVPCSIAGTSRPFRVRAPLACVLFAVRYGASTSRRLSTLPTKFLGSSERNSICRGTL